MSKRSIKFIDLFAGLGGFHLAAAKLGAECVFACEINDQLRKTYKANFGIEPLGDIRKIPVNHIPKHDLLCAGFPCQPFSKAGDQLGWEDKVRGTVIFDVINILRIHKPEFLILENVAHFVRHDDGNTYRELEKALSDIGYSVDKKQFSPHLFGVPQIRERMYLVGKRGSLAGFEWPRATSKGNMLSIKSVLDSNPSEAKPLSDKVIQCLDAWQEFLDTFPDASDIPSFPIWSMEFKATYPYKYDSLYDVKVESLRKKRGVFGRSLNTRFRKNILERVPSYARRMEGAFPSWKQDFIRQNRKLYRDNKSWIDKWIHNILVFPPSLQKLEWNCKGEELNLWNNLIQFRASGVRVKRPTTSPSLVAMTTTQVPIIGWEKRYMTLRECARLQSMDELTAFPPYEQAMEALGNAVNVKVVGLILQNLLKLRQTVHQIQKNAIFNNPILQEKILHPTAQNVAHPPP